MRTPLLCIIFIVGLGLPSFSSKLPQPGEEIIIVGTTQNLQVSEANDSDILSVFPNPFSQSPTIKINMESRQIKSLKVYDLIGKEHFKADLSNKEGMLRYTPNFSELQPGIYFCSLYGEDGGLIETKKMVKIQ